MKCTRGLRVLCVCLVAVFALVALCGCSKAMKAKENLDLIYVKVTEARKLTKDINEVIDWQIKVIDDMLAEKAAKEAAGEVFVHEEDHETEDRMDARVRDYLNTVSGWREDIEKLEKTGLMQVDKTQDAAIEYFSRIETALSDMLAICEFDNALESAQMPISEFQNQEFADKGTQIVALYEVIQVYYGELKSIDCPEFMVQVFDRFTETEGTFCTVLEQWVQAIQLGDNLRYAASVNMYSRVLARENQYTLALNKDFATQYRKVGERLNSSIAELGEELYENVQTLYDAM